MEQIDGSCYNMEDLINQDDIRVMKSMNDNGGTISTDTEKTGWGFFSPEISFFLVDFCREQLTPMQFIIFYAYYVNGLTLKEIAERLYGPDQENMIADKEEKEADNIIKEYEEENNKEFHSSHQSVHKQIKKIERKLRYSWQYMDRWNHRVVTQKVNGKKVRIFNPNKKEK